MGEKSIIAYFRTEKNAQKAVRELKERGFDTVRMDHFSQFPGENVVDLDNPISESPSSLASITMGAAISSRDAGVLAAAHPDASGMAGADGMESPENVIVTVVTEEDREEEARSLLEWAGGRL
ncbi:MAG: hypothetical protein CW342_04025 [Thermoactinomycetaceae bacterium]|jgi:hypothetical protein|nr:hypothetical protein [Bacillota bacterium]MBO2532045.1 hypothetical protein [Thermoactinomycetaceae bacterium]